MVLWPAPCLQAILPARDREMAMKVTSERRNGVLWLCVSGRINILNATKFEEAVAGEIEDGDRAVIIDLEKLVYISSAGLYAVLKIAKLMWGRDTEFALCAPSDEVHLIFERIGFTSIMPIHSTRAEVLASLED